ncbi:MAG: exodeoxyribonuclease VII large subunit, partial [Propionibacteriaceae bacterium]|nr:exodeoxyribonuclease VII large subunit [Propionibacteriaceae bacterium]
ANAAAAAVRASRQRARNAISNAVAAQAASLAELRARPVLRDPVAAVDVHAQRLADLRARLSRGTALRRDQEAERINALLTRVRALSPKATLARGYAILALGEETVTSVGQIDPGDEISGYLRDGLLKLSVISKDNQGEADASQT